jgi:acetyl-CoA synthetase
MATAAQTIDTLLLEQRRYPPPEDFTRQANATPEIYSRSFEEFWETEGRERVTWFEPFTDLYEWEPPYAKWYLGGKLNVCFNCVDRHVEAGLGEKVAYHWEGEPEGERRSITFAELQQDVVRFANALKGLGVRKGTPVAIYMSMVPELPVAMLACARLGAPHTVVFGGFSADSLSGRMNDMECELLITQDEGLRGGNRVPLKRNADEALAESPSVKHCIVLKRTGGEIEFDDGRNLWWDELVEGVGSDPESCPCEPMDSEDLLYLLYTSGTTATPKGIVHTTAGYLVGVATTHHYIFDVKPDSVYWCAADIGWVTGHSYIVYGPLCNGTTGVIYEGVPGYPDKDRWWAIVERYGVDIFYTAPTAIRTHMKWGPEYAEKHDLSSIRLLGTVGEPINPEAWVWYREHIGADRTPVVDTWWQTETGMIMISALPGVTTLKPGSATRSFPGVDAAVYDESGNEVPPRPGRLPGAATAMARDAPRDPPRPRSLRRDVLVAVQGRLLRRGRRPPRRGRRLLAAGPRRRRDERLRPPDLDDRGRVGARRPPGGGRGGRLRAQRPDHRPGDRRLRDPEGQPGGLRGDARRAPRPRRPRDRADREACEHRVHAGAAEDAERQDHAPPAPGRRRAPAARRAPRVRVPG